MTRAIKRFQSREQGRGFEQWVYTSGVYLAELQKGELRWGFTTYRSHVNADKKHIARMKNAVKRWKSMELTKHHARWRRSAASRIGAKRKIKTAAENLINRMVIHAWRKWSGTAKALVTTEGTMRAILVRVRLLKLTAAYNTWKGVIGANEEAKRVVNVYVHYRESRAWRTWADCTIWRAKLQRKWAAGLPARLKLSDGRSLRRLISGFERWHAYYRLHSGKGEFEGGLMAQAARYFGKAPINSNGAAITGYNSPPAHRESPTLLGLSTPQDAHQLAQEEAVRSEEFWEQMNRPIVQQQSGGGGEGVGGGRMMIDYLGSGASTPIAGMSPNSARAPASTTINIKSVIAQRPQTARRAADRVLPHGVGVMAPAPAMELPEPRSAPTKGSAFLEEALKPTPFPPMSKSSTNLLHNAALAKARRSAKVRPM